MSLFFSTIKYRLKSLFTTAYGIVFFALALVVAFSPFIGLIIPDAPVPIGWIDEDNTNFSRLLLKNVQALDVVWVTVDDEETLIANLQTGKLEGVFVIKEGFEEAVKSGDFEETLQILRSPYSTAAGVISESVGGEAMRLWLTCTSANAARTLGGDALYQTVFDDVNAGTDEPIISLVRQNAAAETGEVTPLLDAAYSSIYLLAALCCFFMLSGLAMTKKNADFSARLKSRAFSMERYRLSVSIADTLYIFPCVAVPLAAFGLSGAGHLILPLLLMFVLYVLKLGCIASLVSRLKNQTVLMLAISIITI
ncbi:MAG: ABC transporter permease [Eubacteriales bacterium]|nr:ABC transporter permease [Eubacteriales bacterium]